MLNKFLGLPGLLRIGALVFAIGSALDLLYHVLPPTLAPGLASYLGQDGERAHLVIMVGMFLMVAGLLAYGSAQAARRWMPATDGKETAEKI